METTRSAFLGVTVPPDLLAALKRLARADDRPLSAYVRRLLVDALARQELHRNGATR